MIAQEHFRSIWCRSGNGDDLRNMLAAGHGGNLQVDVSDDKQVSDIMGTVVIVGTPAEPARWYQ